MTSNDLSDAIQAYGDEHGLEALAVVLGEWLAAIAQAAETDEATIRSERAGYTVRITRNEPLSHRSH